MNYVVIVIGCNDSTLLKQLEKSLHHTIRRSVIYEEKEKLIILAAEYSLSYLTEKLTVLSNKYSNIFIGIGSLESQILGLYHSYKNALVSYRLSRKIIPKSILCYDDLGVYQILADLKEPEIIYPEFVHNTLGKLMDYDSEHKTKYMAVLKDFFENDCSITQTAHATFYHQNTLKYKIRNIKEILGYDIMTNENRVKIMLSLYILQMEQDYFIEN